MSLLAAPAALWFALDVRPDVAHGDKEKNSGLTLVLLAMGWVAFGVVFGLMQGNTAGFAASMGSAALTAGIACTCGGDKHALAVSRARGD